ncbi:MAG: sensor histidine kinase [Lachnospiraceae bacterium]|nr:sensor histidine kinase [Lachnospiraceae bacterium]
MKSRKPNSFKDNIYRMFLRYAIAPAFIITFAGVIITFLLWGYSEIDMTKKSNEAVKEEIERVMVHYRVALEEIAGQTELVTEPLEQEKQVELFERLYKLSNSLGYRAKLYIFNNEYEPVVKSTGEVPADFVANWGIFRQMNRTPDEMAMKVVTDSENQSAALYFGKTMMEDDTVIGYAVFVLDSSQFRVLLTNVPRQSIISDSFDWIFLANNYALCDNLERIDREYAKSTGYIRCNGKRFYITYSSILENQLYIYSVSDVSSQFSIFKWVGVLVVLLFAIILVFFMKGAEKISIKSTRDIDIIADAFEKVKQGDLNNYISIDSSTEFKTIGESYNLMLDSLKEQIEKNKEMIAHMAFAQIKQLESQINPHFLFNTLENIRVMCKIDVVKADKMIINLSTLLRYSISNAEEDVTVRQDMKITNSYLSILKIRFNTRFQYTVDIDEEIMDCVIPKLLIQPLIENSIKYGFGDKENLKVEIKGYREEDHLIFICKDDGIGIEESVLKELQYTLEQPKNRSTHLGLYNIHKRIHLKYNGDYGIRIQSKQGEGTTLTLKLPAYKREENVKNIDCGR